MVSWKSCSHFILLDRDYGILYWLCSSFVVYFSCFVRTSPLVVLHLKFCCLTVLGSFNSRPHSGVLVLLWCSAVLGSSVWAIACWLLVFSIVVFLHLGSVIFAPPWSFESWTISQVVATKYCLVDCVGISVFIVFFGISWCDSRKHVYLQFFWVFFEKSGLSTWLVTQF